jgi:hypothetical protein
MLPGSAKMGSVRVLIMCIAVVFYGFFFIVTVLSLLGVVA